MQRIVTALAATLIWAAAASPSPASAGAQDHVKAKHAKRIHCGQKKARRVVESKSKRSKPRVERNAKRVSKTPQHVVEKVHVHGLVQVEPTQAALHAATQAKLDSPDTANPLVALAMRYDGKNPTGWSHNWCAHYLNMILQEAGYPSGGNLPGCSNSEIYPPPERGGRLAVACESEPGGGRFRRPSNDPTRACLALLDRHSLPLAGGGISLSWPSRSHWRAAPAG